MTTKSIQTQIAAITMLLLLFPTYRLLAQTQADAGQDTTVCKGNCITLGGSMNSSWCFHWTPHEGLSDPHIANPSACPQNTTTYTLTVTGEEYSFVESDQVTVNVVVVSDITFSVDPLPNVQSTTSQASATTSSGGDIIWSIEGDAKGCTISSSGLITASNTPGSITVVAKDSLNPDCKSQATLCVGDGSDCCAAYTNTTKSFGPINITFPGPLYPAGAPENEYCSYSVSAEVSIEMQGVFQKTYSIPGVTVGWKEKTGNASDFKEVTVMWDGNYDAGTFGMLDATITQVGLTVDNSGDLSGTVTFEVSTNEDKNLGGIAILRKGVTGSFTYTYTTAAAGPSLSGGGGFGGEWNFNGITNFHIDLAKGSTVIATVTVGSFDAEGNINNAVLKAATPAQWITNKFDLTLDSLSLEFNYSIPDNEIEFVRGTGGITVGNIQNVQGDISLSLTFTPDNVNATVSLTDAKAFECTVQGTLSVDFDYEFNLQTLGGSGISAKHDDFDQAFTDVEFEIKDGALEKFGIGSIEVKYKNKITFSMTNAMYSKAMGMLTFDAKVELPSIQMDVSEFKIDLNGVVTVGNIQTQINQSPVTITINIGWSADEFHGDFAGSFSGGLAIDGTLVIGATATFNYGHASLKVTVPGIPLGTSGLKIKSLAGEFGYNWQAPDGPEASGGPEQGALTIGFGLGIADMADIVMIEGYIRLTLGAATQIFLKGNVKVTANPPHYFNGELAIWYTLGSYSVTGSIASDINFPAGSGSAVKFGTGNVIFEVGSNKWSVVSSAAVGKLFNEIDVTASVNVWAWLASPSAITGTIGGNLNWNYQYDFAYPTNFNPSSCATADATDSNLGFGVKGDMKLNLSGSISAQMNQDGIVGNMTVQASAAASLAIKWPCFITCAYECVDTYNATVEGSLAIQKTSSGARIFGSVTVKYQNESENGDVDFNI